MIKNIKHSGIKGMKWGVRKSREPTGSNDNKSFSTLKKKKIKDMSNDEIKEVAKRMRLINEYRRGSFIKGGKQLKDMSNEEIELAVKKSKLIAKTVTTSPLLTFKTILSLKNIDITGVDKALERINLEQQLKALKRSDIMPFATLVNTILATPAFKER